MSSIKRTATAASGASGSESLKMANATTRPIPPPTPQSAYPAPQQAHHHQLHQDVTLTQSPRFPLPHFPISLSDIQARAHMSTSSLALLLPSTAATTSSASSPPTRPVWPPSSSSPSSPQSSSPYNPSPTAAYLERQSQFLVEAINANNFTSQVTDQIAPGFRAAIGDFNTSEDFHTHTAAHQHVKRSQGLKYRVRVVNASADVDERSGCATVFQLLDVLGYHESMRTQAICVLKWARSGEEGRWLLEGLYGMSGLGNADG